MTTADQEGGVATDEDLCQGNWNSGRMCQVASGLTPEGRTSVPNVRQIKEGRHKTSPIFHFNNPPELSVGDAIFIKCQQISGNEMGGHTSKDTIRPL